MQKIVTGFNWERDTKLYEKIGVRQFKKFVPVGDFWIMVYNKFSSKKLKVVNSKQTAIVWLLFTLSVEFLHFIAFLIILWFTVESAMNADYYSMLEWTGINMFINLYPIMIQRYNRIRILKIFKINFEDIETFTL